MRDWVALGLTELGVALALPGCHGDGSTEEDPDELNCDLCGCSARRVRCQEGTVSSCTDGRWSPRETCARPDRCVASAVVGLSGPDDTDSVALPLCTDQCQSFPGHCELGLGACFYVGTEGWP